MEDDYDTEYRYDRRPVPALQPQDPAHVAYVSGLSKALAPALRLGWLIAPAPLREELVRTRLATDHGSPVLPQLTLARLMEDGTLDAQLRRLRTRHRARRDAAVRALAVHLPQGRVHGAAAGLHLMVELPEGVDDQAVSARALEEGIAIDALSAHRRGEGPPGLVIGYGPHPPAVMDRAVETLGRLLRP